MRKAGWSFQVEAAKPSEMLTRPIGIKEPSWRAMMSSSAPPAGHTARRRGANEIGASA